MLRSMLAGLCRSVMITGLTAEEKQFTLEVTGLTVFHWQKPGKRDGIDRKKGATVFGEYTVRYMQNVRLADSTRAMKVSVIERDH